MSSVVVMVVALRVRRIIEKQQTIDSMYLFTIGKAPSVDLEMEILGIIILGI